MTQEEYSQNLDSDSPSGADDNDALANINDRLFGETKKKKAKMRPRTAIGGTIVVISLIAMAISGFFTSSIEIPEINIATPNQDNNEKLVYASGKVTSSEFTDPMFSITAKGVYLQRVVEMYQWVEENNEYTKKWSKELIDISSEDAKSKGISNPSEMPFFSEKWNVESIKLGNFSLSEEMIKTLDVPEPVVLTGDDFQKLNSYGQKAFKLHDGKYFFGIDPEKPRIGDIQISFVRLAPDIVTVLAKQLNSSLMGYKTDKAVIEKIVPGLQPLADMTKGLPLKSSALKTWLIRIVAILTTILGVAILIGKFSRKEVQNKQEEFPNKPLENSNFGLAPVEDVEEEYSNEEALPESINTFVEESLPERNDFSQEQPIVIEEPINNIVDRKLATPLEFSAPEAAPDEVSSIPPVAMTPPVMTDFASENNFNIDDNTIPEGVESITDEDTEEEPQPKGLEFPSEVHIEPEKQMEYSAYVEQPVENILPDVDHKSFEDQINDDYVMDIPDSVEMISGEAFDDAHSDELQVPKMDAPAFIPQLNDLPDISDNDSDSEHFISKIKPAIPEPLEFEEKNPFSTEEAEEESGEESAFSFGYIEDDYFNKANKPKAKIPLLPPPPPPMRPKPKAVAPVKEEVIAEANDLSFSLPNIPDDFDPRAEMSALPDIEDELQIAMPNANDFNDHSEIAQSRELHDDSSDPFDSHPEEIEFKTGDIAVEPFAMHDDDDGFSPFDASFEEDDENKQAAG